MTLSDELFQRKWRWYCTFHTPDQIQLGAKHKIDGQFQSGYTTILNDETHHYRNAQSLNAQCEFMQGA